jgi:hypothetical protein
LLFDVESSKFFVTRDKAGICDEGTPDARSMGGEFTNMVEDRGDLERRDLPLEFEDDEFDNEEVFACVNATLLKCYDCIRIIQDI